MPVWVWISCRLRQRLAQLRAQAADVDVDGAVVATRLPAPDLGVEFLAGHDPLRVRGEGDEQLQLAHRQAQRPAVDQGRVLVRTDLQASGCDRCRSCPVPIAMVASVGVVSERRLPGREAAVNDL